MQANFFNPSVSHHLLQRLQSLSPDAKATWGIMSPAQMLRHLQLENDLALGHYQGKDYSNFMREWAFKMVIKGKMSLPSIFSKMRLVPAIPELDIIKSGIAVGSFDEEKEKVMAQFQQLLHTKSLSTLHPGIGKMNREEWGLFYGWHTDYHFRQFGI